MVASTSEGASHDGKLGTVWEGDRAPPPRPHLPDSCLEWRRGELKTVLKPEKLRFSHNRCVFELAPAPFLGVF